MKSGRESSTVLAIALAIFALPLPSLAGAQNDVVNRPLRAGTIVRARLAAGEHVQGRLVEPFSPDSDTLRICRYPAPPCRDETGTRLDIAANGILSIELRRRASGRKRATNGALIGGLVGFALGILVQQVGGPGELPVLLGLGLGALGATIPSAATNGTWIWVPAIEPRGLPTNDRTTPPTS